MISLKQSETIPIQDNTHQAHQSWARHTLFPKHLHPGIYSWLYFHPEIQFYLVRDQGLRFSRLESCYFLRKWKNRITQLCPCSQSKHKSLCEARTLFALLQDWPPISFSIYVFQQTTTEGQTVFITTVPTSYSNFSINSRLNSIICTVVLTISRGYFQIIVHWYCVNWKLYRSQWKGVCYRFKQK